MKLVIIESPYAGNITRNVAYLRRAIQDCLSRGEAPYASHGLYPGPLDDDIPDQRALGIQAGEAWRACADATVVYRDYGISSGMDAGIEAAEALGHEIVYRELGLPEPEATTWSTSGRWFECPRCSHAYHMEAPPRCTVCAWTPTTG